MRSILGALEVHHAVNAGEGCAATLVSMRVELLLGEDVTTGLALKSVSQRLDSMSDVLPLLI